MLIIHISIVFISFIFFIFFKINSLQPNHKYPKKLALKQMEVYFIFFFLQNANLAVYYFYVLFLNTKFNYAPSSHTQDNPSFLVKETCYKYIHDFKIQLGASCFCFLLLDPIIAIILLYFVLLLIFFF